ncbi:class I SAM-dependent methyltransferase [Sneathiella glossodoripedis]|uniref:class I SAM-dependent methyltransferase n=1 Tax=Sneathiella glossodoripedis TaxID=418853 RepID=UPI00046E5352|nr:class I SAM-dependent methyltransferase [Sneathiella glossodoripedis]
MQIDVELGKAARMQQLGDLKGAVQLYQKVLKANPKTAIAHYNLALILKSERKFTAAEKSFKSAIKISPDYFLAWQAYSRLLLERGKFKDAIRAALQYVKIQQQSPASVQFLIDQLANCSSAKLGVPGREALQICLNSTAVDFDGTLFTAMDFLSSHPVLATFFTGNIPTENLPQYFLQKERQIIEALLEPTCATILTRLILPTAAHEHALISLRDLLGKTACKNATAEVLEAQAIIALQMELREYSVPTTGYTPKSQTDLSGVLYTAMYQPLSEAIAKELLEGGGSQLNSLPYAQKILEKFGSEYPQIQLIKNQIKALNPVQDETSKRVQDQYEESPYPRWFGLRTTDTVELPKLINRLFPALNISSISNTPDILVAGCGTGRHALRTSIRIQNSTVTAIDLSRASLSYGIFKAKKLSIDNVQFAQADICALPSDIGCFDLIECCGVLHHMAKPEEAWGQLTQFLKPGGVMKVALYSKIARQDVSSARKLLGLDPDRITVDDIRQARQKLLTLDDTHPAKSVTNDIDFYSVAGCRDFLFNTQETCYTLPEIKEMLARLKLDFCGFEFPSPEPLSHYKKAFPNDPKAVDLDNWAQIEEHNPLLFRGMYQFWCRPVQG